MHSFWGGDLSSFSRHNYFEVLPHIFACINSHLLLLLSCILLYGCITITLISSWWTIELCPVFEYYNNTAMNVPA